MLKKGKKGEVDWIIFVAAELVIFAIIFFSFMSMVKGWTSGDVINKVYISRDTALLIDSLYSVPYNVYVMYPNKVSEITSSVSKYTLEFKEGVVSVYSDMVVDVTRASYHYTENGKMKIDKKFIHPSSLVFYKCNDAVNIEDFKTFAEISETFCSGIDAEGGILSKRFVVNPVDDYDAFDIADSVNSIFFNNVVLSRDKGDTGITDNRIQEKIDEKPTDIILNLNTDITGKKIVIKTPQETEKRVEITALVSLLNYFIKKNVKDIEIEEKIVEDISLFNANTGKITVQIEIPLDTGISNNGLIAKAIADAIRRYYGG